MYEAECNRRVEPATSLPESVRDRFAEFRERIVSRSLLPWGEHCTECNWPTCYTTCELYAPREDGACRLFIDGSVRVDIDRGLNPYVLKIRLKRWAKLWAVGSLALFPPGKAARRERANIRVGALARSLPLPAPLKARVLRKTAYLRRRRAERPSLSNERPDAFLLESYNPNARRIDLTFTIRMREAASPRAFQRMIRLEPGFTRERIPFTDITGGGDFDRPFEVEIVPNDCDDTTLYFGIMDFVRERPGVAAGASSSPQNKKWKCIVWDLDQTLWEGILIEDGPARLRVKPEVVAVIEETDRRGILHSIASKNDPDEALKVLDSSGLSGYFLYPQIGWRPKSESVSRIARLLNIGVDSLAFVDDQPFEREEVRAALPQVAVIDARESAGLPDRPECRVPVTEESRARRSLYRQQERRDAVLEAFPGDYTSFLKDCGIQLRLSPLSEANLERVYELAQRTNQMNFSGNRYPREQLREIMRSPHHETFVMGCSDKFGSYGIVGFAVVDLREPRLLDLMFSCRIQSKRVEHAFLGYLLTRYARLQSRDLHASYRRTEKNVPAGRVFEEIGFRLEAENGDVQSLVFPKDRAWPDEGLIAISDGSAG